MPDGQKKPTQWSPKGKKIGRPDPELGDLHNNRYKEQKKKKKRLFQLNIEVRLFSFYMVERKPP